MIEAMPSGAVTAERIAVAQKIFAIAGFHQGFATAEQIDKARDWAFQNGAELDKLPKYVLGNLEGLRKESYRRTLMALLRRIAQFLQLSVVRRRQQYLKNGKNTTKYMYKIVS